MSEIGTKLKVPDRILASHAPEHANTIMEVVDYKKHHFNNRDPAFGLKFCEEHDVVAEGAGVQWYTPATYLKMLNAAHKENPAQGFEWWAKQEERDRAAENTSATRAAEAAATTSPTRHHSSTLAAMVQFDDTGKKKTTGAPIYTCKHCTKECAGSKNGGATNLRSHLKSCKPFKAHPDYVQVFPKTSFAMSPQKIKCKKSERWESNTALFKYVVDCDLPFRTVDSASFKAFNETLDPTYTTPSAADLRRRRRW